MSTPNTQITPQQCFNGAIPKEGPKCIPQNLDWDLTDSYEFDMMVIKQQGKLSGIQSVFVDNSTNDQPVTFFSSIINQTISIPVGYQGYFPLLVTDQVKVTFNSTGATGNTPIIFMNFPIAASVWPALVEAGAVVISPNPMPVTDAPVLAELVLMQAQLVAMNAALAATLQVNQVHQTVTVTDHSGTIAAGGTAQNAMAANAARNTYRLQNIDATEDLWFRDDGNAAAIGAEGSYLLTAGGSVQGNSQAAISVIAATINHKFSAMST